MARYNDILLVAVCVTVATSKAAPVPMVTSYVPESTSETAETSSTIVQETPSPAELKSTPVPMSLISRTIPTTSLESLSTPSSKEVTPVTMSTTNAITAFEKLTSTSVSESTSTTSVLQSNSVTMDAVKLESARHWAHSTHSEAMTHFKLLAANNNLVSTEILVKVTVRGVECPRLPPNIVDQARDCTGPLEILGVLHERATTFIPIMRTVAQSRYRQPVDYIMVDLRSLQHKLIQLIGPFSTLILPTTTTRSTTTRAPSSEPRDLSSIMGRLACLSEQMSLSEEVLRTLESCQGR